MRRLMQPWAEERAMTIIEVMVAMMVLLVGVLGTVTMIDRATASTSDTKARDRATSLARDLTEAARGIPYPSLISTTIADELSGRMGLEDVKPGPAYEVRRGGFEYTVAPSVCTVDDTKDGLGPHTAGGFCPGAAGATDEVPDDYRQVTIAVSWRSDGRDKSMRQVTTVNNPGSAFGPAVTNINQDGTVLPTGTALTIWDDIVSADFDITTNRPSDAVRWAVDGVDQTPQAAKKGGSDTTWSIAWFLANLVDGTYQLTGQAYDATGLSAGPYTTSVILNRFPPLSPTGVVAGRNGPLLDARVDIEWLANKERDIDRYQVFRMVGETPALSVDVPICTVLSTKPTTCFEQPAPGGSLRYYVVALDKDQTGQLRRGAPSAPATVNEANMPPTAVENLTATTNGDVTLSWNPPLSAGEPTDTIEFYRVYRDGQAVGDRYARVGISTPPITYTDRNAGGGHSYWVSAVDSQLGESPLAGPVP